MSRPREIALRETVFHFLTAYLLAAGMALCVFGAVFPGRSLWPVLSWSALFCLAAEGLSCIRGHWKGLLILLMLLAAGASAFFGFGPGHTLIELGKAVYLTLWGLPDAVLPYADAARIALCLFFAVLGCLLSWDTSFPLACFCVVTAAALSGIFGGNEKILLYSLPAFAGLVILLSRSHPRSGEEKRFSVFLIAAAAVLSAFLLLPGKTDAVQPFSSLADHAREWMEDYLFFNEYRTSFSLEGEGFQPLEDRMGGTAVPNDHTVLQVETERTLLLRGKTYDAYTGLNWYDSLSARRYLYISPRYESLKEQLFDLNRPLAGAEGIQEKTARVKVLSQGTTTLFAPSFTRHLQMENDRMVLYFNKGAELFLTRDMEEGDSYLISYLPLSAESEKTRQAIAACAVLSDPDLRQIREDYLKLPNHIQQEIFDIAEKAAAGAETPYEKALAIARYLRSHYTYTLTVKEPPEQVDFTAWFLLGEKEGYCTYFATAMTVLCRIAGVPARYVTGFLAVPDENGVALVTGENAHAWTEVYLNGLGWLPLDATPRGDHPDEDEDDGENGTDPVPPSPSPTPSPTPEPSPAPEQTPTPSPDPEDRETPTPEPSPAPEQTPAPDPGENEPPENHSFPWLWLLLPLLIVLVILRYLQTEPVRRAARHPAQAAEILMQGIFGLLTLRKLRRGKPETLQSFAARADEALRGTRLPPLQDLTERYSAMIYGRHPAESAPFRETYLAYRSAAPMTGRLSLAVRRMLGKA